MQSMLNGLREGKNPKFPMFFLFHIDMVLTLIVHIDVEGARRGRRVMLIRPNLL